MAGSTISAADRHKQRVGAASVRIDMADTLGQMDGSPGAEPVAAWLNHLSDEEALERVSRLTPTHTHSPEIMRRNFEVLKRLCDEAVTFGAIEPAGSED
ncbi:MAG: hypothetical protein ABIW49_09765 [Knoellia sp.]